MSITPDTPTAPGAGADDDTFAAFFALGGPLPAFDPDDLVHTVGLERTYGPRFATARLVRTAAVTDYDDNDYYSSSYQMLVAADVIDVRAALAAAAEEWLRTHPEYERHDFWVGTALDEIDAIVLWRHGIVCAYSAGVELDFGHDDAVFPGEVGR